ncbi:MAG: metal ABC transporter ATP-binding protein [Archaeoglobus sp.]|nr:metal ABC transporter ATP-binding protein [Archaeoglobus sp.]
MKLNSTEEKLNTNAIVANGVEFGYNDQSILSDITFQVKKGEFVAITGPNGSGKTTLLKLILGILQPRKGEIVVMGYNTREKEKIMSLAGFMPQKEHISTNFPILVKDVVMLGLGARRGIVKSGKAYEREGIEAIKAVGLKDEIWNKRFAELSGGQQQRVLLARALAIKPKILLLDEPFNGVDIPSQNKIIELLSELKEKDVTVLLVIHNVNPLLHEIDKIMLLNRRIIAFGKPDEIFTEENLIATYGASIPIIYCEEGFAHPVYSDIHG